MAPFGEKGNGARSASPSRYTCLLILAARATQDCDCKIAVAKPLSRREVRSTRTLSPTLAALGVDVGTVRPEVELIALALALVIAGFFGPAEQNVGRGLTRPKVKRRHCILGL